MSGHLGIGMQRVARVLSAIAVIHGMAGPHRRLLYAALLMSLIVAVVDGALTMVAIMIVIALLGSDGAPAVVDALKNASGLSSGQGTTIVNVMLIAAALLLRHVATGISQSLTQLVGARVAAHVRTQMVANLVRARFSFLDKLRSGSLRQIVMHEVGAIMRSAQSYVELAAALFSALVGFLILLQLSPLLTGLLFCFAALLLPVKFLLLGVVHRNESRSLEASLAMSNLLNEVILGIRQVKLLNREDEFCRKVSESNRMMERRQFRSSMLLTWDPVFTQGSIILIVVIFFSANSIGQWVSTPVLLSFLLAVYRALPSLVNASSCVNRIVSYHPRLIEAATHYSFPPNDLERQVGHDIPRASAQTLQFSGVDLDYDGRAVLKGVDLMAHRGELIAIVGPSGSGKTTLINALMGAYPISRGEILIDEQPVSGLSLRALRSTIGLVSQDVHLFNTSIEDVIRGGNETLDLAAVKKAATRAAADRFIEALPNGYQTIVGERGARLSGGERQRLLIAQCFARNVAVMVLDEATSALDIQAEAQILDDLDGHREDKIVLLITHRLHNISRANRIYVVDRGRVVESGTWHELVSSDGHVRSMMNAQHVNQFVTGA